MGREEVKEREGESLERADCVVGAGNVSTAEDLYRIGESRERRKSGV